MIDAGEINLRAMRGWPLLTHAEWVSLCDPARAHELEGHFLPCPLHLIGLLPDDAADARHLLQSFGTRPGALPEEQIGDAAELMIREQEHGGAHGHELTIPAALLWHLARLHLLVSAALAWGPERISESRQLSPLLRRELACATQIGVKQGLSFLGPLLNVSAPHVNVIYPAPEGEGFSGKPEGPTQAEIEVSPGQAEGSTFSLHLCDFSSILPRNKANLPAGVPLTPELKSGACATHLVSLIALLGAEDPAHPDAPDDEVAQNLLRSVRTVLGRRAPSVETTPVQATLNAFLAAIHTPRSTP